MSSELNYRQRVKLLSKDIDDACDGQGYEFIGKNKMKKVIELAIVSELGAQTDALNRIAEALEKQNKQK